MVAAGLYYARQICPRRWECWFLLLTLTSLLRLPSFHRPLAAFPLELPPLGSLEGDFVTSCETAKGPPGAAIAVGLFSRSLHWMLSLVGVIFEQALADITAAHAPFVPIGAHTCTRSFNQFNPSVVFLSADL